MPKIVLLEFKITDENNLRSVSIVKNDTEFKSDSKLIRMLVSATDRALKLDSGYVEHQDFVRSLFSNCNDL